MRLRNRWQQGLAGLSLVAGLASASVLPTHAAAAQPPAASSPRAKSEALVKEDAYEVLFTVPVGAGSLEYSPERREMERWGPKALALAPDGSFVIANSYRLNLLRYSATGLPLDTIDLSTYARSITDLKVTPAGIFVLDGAAPHQVVFHLDARGSLIGRHSVPAELQGGGLSGLALGSGGEVLLEHEGRVKHWLLQANGQLAPRSAARPEVSGQPLTITRPDWSSPSTHGRGRLAIGATPIDIEVPHMLATPRLLGSGSPRDFYLIVEEVTHDEEAALLVDQTLRHYDVDGRLLGMARVPLKDQAVVIDHPVTVGHDGAVYGLMAHAERVSVVRFHFTPTLEPALPAEPTRLLAEKRLAGAAADTSLASISRAQIRDKANQYNNSWKYLSANSAVGACAGRVKPRYFSGEGWAHSVAYDWGGWDDVGQYSTYMDQGYKAGDIDVTVEECSRGVDCSGFVSRAWYLSYKRGTYTLPEVATRLSGYWLIKVGDIMNHADHVRLIETQNPDGMNAWEATVDAGYDRAMWRWLPLSRYGGYTPYRYNSLLDP